MLVSSLFFAFGSETVEYHKPVEKQHIYKGAEGFAPNELCDKMIIFDDSQSSLMLLDAVVKNTSLKKEFQLQFKENRAETIDPSDQKKKVLLVYSKLRPNVAVIAQEKEASLSCTEQYVLIFTSPTEGVAQCTRIMSNASLEEVVVNIRFHVK